MYRIFTILILLTATCALSAQKKQVAAKKTRTTQTAVRKTNSAKNAAAKKTKATTKKGNTANYSTGEIRGLQSQRTQIQQKIKEQERKLAANKADVKSRLENLMTINSEINQRQRSIDTIQKDISHLESNIGLLKSQLKTLEEQLQERKVKFVKSMHYMARHRSIQEKLTFIFSAKSLTQMYRRLRFVREYAAYQRNQGEILKQKQRQIDQKNLQLEQVKGHKGVLLYKGKQAHAALQGQQAEQQKIVAGLQNQQKTIQQVINEQRKKDALLNAQIDRLIAEEVAKARARAAEEAKRKAAIEAAKKRAEELARKKAAAEAAARENARRIAAAKAEEERLKAAAEAAEAAKKSAKERAQAAQAAREARAAREAAERKAEAEKRQADKDIADTKKESNDVLTFSVEDRKLSSNFEANKGRLPMPITGGYKVVSHFGQYNVEGLQNVRLDNKGINIKGSAGCQARSIFSGEVSAVFGFGGTMVVMVRHGAYISVYCNLSSVSVHRGQHVSARQPLGNVGSDNILQFQLRKETAKLNPESWLGR